MGRGSMFFDCFYTHDVKVFSETTVADRYGGIKKTWAQEGSVMVFMDTPNTERLVEASKLGIVIDRDLYAPYNMTINPKWRFEFDGFTYEASGTLEDQGTQREVNRLPLRKVHS